MSRPPPRRSRWIILPPFSGRTPWPYPRFRTERSPGTLVSTDYSFGYGDRTLGIRLDAEIPLVPRHVSFKLWYDVYEFYTLSPAVCAERGIAPGPDGGKKGRGGGDVYVQTRMSILGERRNRPQIILSATIKTASGSHFPERRFYDTPGYYFDFEIAKSFFLKSETLNEIRLVAQGGFLCWETSGSRQNDAPMYGLNVILANRWINLENQIGGYCGWMNNGDRPLAYRAKLTYDHKFVDLFFQYQYGIVDFPYHQIRVGCSFSLSKLTPRYQ